jgi:hypothetical protein
MPSAIHIFYEDKTMTKHIQNDKIIIIMNRRGCSKVKAGRAVLLFQAAELKGAAKLIY